MKIVHIYPASCEYAYPRYLASSFADDRFDQEIMCHTDLEVRYLKGLQELGEECVFFYPRRFNLPVKEFTHRGGYRMVRFPISFFGGKTGRELPLIMLKYIKKEKPDVVHYHGLYGGRYYYPKFFNITALFCKLNKIPFLGWYHTGQLPQGGKHPLLVKPITAAKILALKSCAGITSINHLELDRLFNPESQHYYGIDFSALPYLHTPNTFDSKMFYRESKEEALEKAGLQRDKRYMLMVARLFPEKGLHILLDIMPEVIARHQDVHLLVIGDFIEGNEGYEIEIHRIVKEKNLEKNISFLGRVEHQDGLVDYYNAADVFVLPTMKETFGGVNIEAVACGIPVISTNCGEIPHYLTKGVGILIPPTDRNVLLDGVTKVLSGNFVFNEKEREKILRQYDYRSAAKTLREWYYDILKESAN